MPWINLRLPNSNDYIELKLRGVMTSADRFVGSAPQHGDITCVAVRPSRVDWVSAEGAGYTVQQDDKSEAGNQFGVKHF